MPEKTIVTDQAGEENSNESARVKQEPETSRRNFLQLAMAAGSGLAIYSMAPALARESWLTQQPNCDPAAGGQTLQSIMEIKSAGAGGSLSQLEIVARIFARQQQIFLLASGPPLDCSSGH